MAVEEGNEGWKRERKVGRKERRIKEREERRYNYRKGENEG